MSDADEVHPNQALDYPFQQVAERAQALVESGAIVLFKFTCENCGARQTFEEINKLYTNGSCQECGHVTSLVERGCNYLVVIPQDSENESQ